MGWGGGLQVRIIGGGTGAREVLSKLYIKSDMTCPIFVRLLFPFLTAGCSNTLAVLS